jgi:hypothetical protein
MQRIKQDTDLYMLFKAWVVVVFLPVVPQSIPM